MTVERCYALYKAIQYITKGDILGDIVECGVWRGGSAMLAALTLIQNNQTHRKIYLYDTYEGMSEPTDKDIDIHGVPYRLLWEKEKELLTVSLDKVKKNMFSTGYPKENIIFVKGMVEKTIPRTLPNQIALLRLDTDLYESTYHELIHLYPKVTTQGVMSFYCFHKTLHVREHLFNISPHTVFFVNLLGCSIYRNNKLVQS